MSSNVTQAEFEMEKAFVTEFVSHIKIGHRNYEVAVMSYSDTYNEVVKFGDNIDNAQVISKIQQTTYQPGDRRLSRVLPHVNNEFMRSNGGRSYTASVVFLVTKGPESNPRYQSTVNRYASYLPSHYNITLFVIGVTSHADVPEVTILAQNQRHFFKVDSFSELKSLPDELQQTLCQGICTI